MPLATHDAIRDHVRHTAEKTTTKTKCRHIKKLERWTEKAKTTNANVEPDLSGTQLKKWVCNLSKYNLSDSQSQVLAKGLNYAITPHTVPVDEFIVVAEQAAWQVSAGQTDKLRTEVTGLVHAFSHKQSKSNLSKTERKALEDLRKEDSITFLPADKGKCTVVMDTDEYESKVKSMLSDEKTYKKLPKDPTSAYKRKLIAKLQ